MRTKRSGMTVVEILVVVGIIATLAGLLLPAVHTVQKKARETKQKAQFTTIELGLAAFKSDYGDYPPSFWTDPSRSSSTTMLNYCGAQKLAEALLGWDLLGFHPDSAWQADGLDASHTANTVYHAPNNLEKRKDRYVDLETADAFMLGNGVDALFPPGVSTGQLEPRTYVLCDVFGTGGRRITLSNGKTMTAGTPILYYKANPANLLHDPVRQDQTSACIYDARDNAPLVELGVLADVVKPAGTTQRQHWLKPGEKGPLFQYFYEYIRDPRVQARPWPVRPDSYLLISAGMDGIYGTDDDIRNFGQ